MIEQPIITRHNDVYIYAISGKILENTDSNPIMDSVDENLENGAKFVFDLSNLNTMNSSGINLFLKIFTKIRNTGGELYLCSIPKHIEQLLVITKLNSIFTISQDVDSALSKFKTQDA